MSHTYTSQLLEKIIGGGALDEPKAAIFQIGACLTGTAPLKREEIIKIHSNLDILKENMEYIQKFFALDNIGIEDPLETSQLTAEEQKAEDLMKANTFYDSDQKCWHTRLLWADSPINTPTR